MNGTNEEYRNKVDLLVMYNELYEENTKLKQENEELQEQIVALNTVVSCVERNDLKIDKIKEFVNKSIRHEYRNGNSNEFYLEMNEKELKKFLSIIGGE